MQRRTLIVGGSCQLSVGEHVLECETLESNCWGERVIRHVQEEKNKTDALLRKAAPRLFSKHFPAVPKCICT